MGEGAYKMTNNNAEVSKLQQQAQDRQEIEQDITRLFAVEDEGLQQALIAGKAAGLPEIQISPIQGKLLQVLATACQARKILEIGSLAGYSGIWLARALPGNGKLITLEINARHAEVVRNNLVRAGVGEKTEVRVGPALELLPHLLDEAPFDLVFIDADKAPYPEYLAWALRLTRAGSIIIADNTVRNGRGLRPGEDKDSQGLYRYNLDVIHNPRLESLALAIDEDNVDGFTISVVKPEE
jgi:caffeoyl-CoA O-methyltransferase